MTQTKLATIIATAPPGHREHVPVEQELALLKHFNCSLMNNLSSYPGMSDDMYNAIGDFPESKHIIPIFGYTESWDKADETWNLYPVVDNVYYYNCGGTIDGESWNGLDEPGTRDIDPNGQFAMYEQARAELRCVKAFLPGLKRVVSHPFPMKDMPESRWLKPDVGAWRLSLLEKHMAEYADRLAQVPEVWAYLIDEDFEQFEYISGGPKNVYDDVKYSINLKDMAAWASTIGSRVRAVGATALVINDKSLLDYVFDYVNGKLTPVGGALLNGMVSA